MSNTERRWIEGSTFWQKVEHAERHFSKLREEIRAFFDSGPYALIPKYEPESEQLLGYEWQIRDPPEAVVLALGDTLNNLRAALDHLACSLVDIDVNGGSKRHISFPVAKDALTFEKNLPERTRGMSEEAIEVLQKMQPYQGGLGESLWQLHELNNIDKHRKLVVVSCLLDGMRINYMDSYPTVEGLTEEAFPLMASMTGDEDFFIRRQGDMIPSTDPNFLKQFSPRLNLAINEPNIAQGEPLIRMIGNMIYIVKVVGGVLGAKHPTSNLIIVTRYE